MQTTSAPNLRLLVDWLFVIVHRDNHKGGALAVLSNLEQWVAVRALFLAVGTEVEVIADDTLVANSNDWGYLAAGAAGSSMLNKLLGRVG